MSNVQFGIDHPVVAIRDFDKVREQFRRLGFSPNPVGYHPWGTKLSLLMFKDNFIELIAVDDESKFGTNSVGGFCYGRNVGKFVDRVEGLGLVALHSKDARVDYQTLLDRGLKGQGQIDFRREMKKPDGTPDVAVVSLGLFLNDEQRDVSNFICQQHRPELVWVPAWQEHRNGVGAVTAVTYLAHRPAELRGRYTAFFGKARVKLDQDMLEADSGCGFVRIATPEAVKKLFGKVALPDWNGDTQPHGIAISVATPKFDLLEALWAENGVAFTKSPRNTLLISPEQCGNVIMEFERAPVH